MSGGDGHPEVDHHTDQKLKNEQNQLCGKRAPKARKRFHHIQYPLSHPEFNHVVDCMI